MNYYRVITISFVSVILCFGIYFFVYERNSNSSDIGELMYEIIISDDSSDKAVNLLNSIISKGGKSNYKNLARFKLAAIYSTKEITKSQEIYAKLASDKNINKYLRNLAEYLEMVLSFKNDDFSVFKAKIENSIEDNNNNIYWAEMKQLLAISMIRDGDVDSAIKILKEIENSADVNHIMRNSVKELLQIYDN